MGSQLTRRVALMGCGRIANKRHAPILAKSEVPGATLAAVCDVQAHRARDTGDLYDVPHYTDIEDLIKAENPDIISILTPSGLHAQHIEQLLEHRIPLIVEKPLSLRLADAERVTALAQELQVPLFTVLQNRFNPPVRHLKGALDAGRLGDLVSVNVCVRWCRHPEYYADWHGTWQYAGGVLANQAIHHVDLLSWLVGEPVGIVAYADRHLQMRIEDTLVAALRFRYGGLGTIEVTAATRPKDIEGSLTVLGTEGSVKVGGFAVNRMEIWRFNDPQPEDEQVSQSSETPPDVYGYGHKAFYRHVLDCLDHDKPSPIDGRTSLRLVTALYQSVETGVEVCLGSSYQPESEHLGNEWTR
jgi:UDP-N-acetyl-2-amino-2-deoxyglucuronate dehydrogenase